MRVACPYSPQLDWLLNDAAQQLGLSSNHGGLVAAIERGGPSSYVSDEPFHDAAIGAMRSVGLARQLTATFCSLGPATRGLLTAHYERRVYFPPGVEPSLGKLSKAALYLAAQEHFEIMEVVPVLSVTFDADSNAFRWLVPRPRTRRISQRTQLEEACLGATIPSSRQTIDHWRERAREELVEAHGAWDRVRQDQAREWATAKRKETIAI